MFFFPQRPGECVYIVSDLLSETRKCFHFIFIVFFFAVTKSLYLFLCWCWAEGALSVGKENKIHWPVTWKIFYKDDIELLPVDIVVFCFLGDFISKKSAISQQLLGCNASHQLLFYISLKFTIYFKSLLSEEKTDLLLLLHRSSDQTYQLNK